MSDTREQALRFNPMQACSACKGKMGGNTPGGWCECTFCADSEGNPTGRNPVQGMWWEHCDPAIPLPDREGE